jgi:signal transduction histidine kinase
LAGEEPGTTTEVNKNNGLKQFVMVQIPRVSLLLGLLLICIVCREADTNFTQLLLGETLSQQPGLVLNSRTPQALRALEAIQLPFSFLAATASVLLFYTFSRSPRTALISILLLLLSLTGIHELFHTTIPLYSVALACLLAIVTNYLRQNQENKDQMLRAAQLGFQMKQKELLQTQLQLVKQQEEERRMFAGHLHDQVLAEVKELKEYLNKAGRNQELDAQTIVDQLNVIDSEIRQVMENLYPSVLTHLGFIGAVDSLIHESSDNFPTTKFRLDARLTDEELQHLREYQALFIYRFVQEALNNAGRHAQARTVITLVELEAANNSNEYLQIVVEDDGIGMPAEPNQQTHSRGLLYMKTKASLLNASFSITAGREGKGTRITLSVPLKDN